MLIYFRNILHHDAKSDSNTQNNFFSAKIQNNQTLKILILTTFFSPVDIFIIN